MTLPQKICWSWHTKNQRLWHWICEDLTFRWSVRMRSYLVRLGPRSMRGSDAHRCQKPYDRAEGDAAARWALPGTAGCHQRLGRGTERGCPGAFRGSMALPTLWALDFGLLNQETKVHVGWRHQCQVIFMLALENAYLCLPTLSLNILCLVMKNDFPFSFWNKNYTLGF